MPDNSCPLCGSPELSQFLYRPDVPVHQNLLMHSRRQARDTLRGDLDMTVCTECGFVFNTAFDPGLLEYGESYDNNQGCSSGFQSHLDDLVELLIDKKGIRDKQVVEVGCGQGQFLQRLVLEGENYGVGFDPSYTGPEKRLDGRMRFETRYYDESCSSVPADVVICRHVIEHVPDPLALLRSVRSAIANPDVARVFFETPCVEWILRNEVVWDFFYEHCSLFTAESLSTAFQLAGFRVDEVRHVFGGQYLWLEASPVASPVTKDGDRLSRLAADFSSREAELYQDWQDRISGYASDGGVALWGAGAKGATFANLIDPGCELIDCLVDLNPNKQGKYVAGSGHAIVDPLQLEKREVAHVVLMNPNYRDENQQILNQAGIVVNLTG